MNSVARTSPKRSTTVSQMIEERIQWRAAPSGNANGRGGRSSRVAGASRTASPGATGSAIGGTVRPRRRLGQRNDKGVMTMSFPGHSKYVPRGQRPMRILVIEDEPRILSFLVKGLEAEGFTVESAVHGVAALERARATHPDLVVLDLLLPGIDGLTVLAELK